MKKFKSVQATLLITAPFICPYTYGMEQSFNAITKALSKATHYVSKKTNQAGYVCNRENHNKYQDVENALKDKTAIQKNRNNSEFQERTKQCNDRTWETQDYIKRNTEGVPYVQIGALEEATKKNYQAMSLIFLEYVLKALQEGRVVNTKHINTFLAGKNLIFEAIEDIWPELKEQSKPSNTPQEYTEQNNSNEPQKKDQTDENNKKAKHNKNNRKNK